MRGQWADFSLMLLDFPFKIILWSSVLWYPFGVGYGHDLDLKCLRFSLFLLLLLAVFQFVLGDSFLFRLI